MEELLIPNPAKQDVASYAILLDGKAADPGYKLLSLSILKEANRVPTAKLAFVDGDAAKRRFVISDSADFLPGKKIEIGIGRDSKNKSAFRGIIVKHAVSVKANGHSQLLVECMDETMRMTMGRRSHYFKNVKDSQVFDELAAKYKIKVDAPQTKRTHPELVQHHVSDWDFLLLRAEANGLLVFPSDGALQIARPVLQDTAALQINYGSSVLEFDSEIDARGQLKNVHAMSWDYANQKLFTADAADPTLKEPGNVSGADLAAALNPNLFVLRHSGHKGEQELQDWADGLLMRSRLAKVRGRAKFSGFAALKPGDTVKISGVGDRFNGNAYVTAVRQDMGKGTWETQIQFGLDPQRYAYKYKDLEDAPSAGLSGAIRGLQIGVTVRLEGDPDGEDRILVRLPVIDNQAEGIWSRMASLDAGNDRGAFFRPEIGDEVIVGFINDDPRDAVVLGMLNSSNKPAPLRALDANNEKGFTTRSKMHLRFNDDSKTILIDTPAGNSITLDEAGMKISIKDQNGNKLEMSPTGISLESNKNIDIKAGAVLTLSGGVSLSIGAPSLAMSAQGDVSISGASAKISGQGLTQITGLPVKIN